MARPFSQAVRVNLRQEPYPYSGILDFFTEYGAHSLQPGNEGWVEFRGDFENGHLVALHLINHIPPLNGRWLRWSVDPTAARLQA